MNKSSQELGHKHRCLHADCRALFYDMGSAEPICPKCGKAHNVEEAIKLKPYRSEEKMIAKDEPEIEADEDEDNSVAGIDAVEDDLDEDVTESIKPKETEPEE